MALRTALSRRRRKIPAIITQSLGYVWPRIWVTQNYPNVGLLCLTQERGNTKKYPNIGLLHLTQGLGNTKTTQTLKK